MKTLILFLILGLLIIGGVTTKFNNEKEARQIELNSEVEGELPLAPQRAETFSISGGENYPVFTKELVVNPFKVKAGETQTFSIWAKDPIGIEKVTAIIFTDSGEEIIKLSLVEGNETEGRWEGSWIVKNIGNSSSYATKFDAQNKKKESTTLNVFWEAEKK